MDAQQVPCQPQVLYPGDTWTLNYSLPDCTNPGVPLALNGDTYEALLYCTTAALPIPVPVTILQAGYAVFAVVVPNTVTSTVIADDQLSRLGTTRLRVVRVSPSGDRMTAVLQPLRVGDIVTGDQSCDPVHRAAVGAVDLTPHADSLEWNPVSQSYQQGSNAMGGSVTQLPTVNPNYGGGCCPTPPVPWCAPVPPTPPTPAPIVSDFVFLQGDDWPVPVAFTDASGTIPINLNGFQPFAEVYFPGIHVPVIVLTQANGGVSSFDPPNGLITFKVGRATTAGAPETVYVTDLIRILICVYDTLGNKRTIGVKSVRVVDPLLAMATDFPLSQTTGIVAAAQQGPPGPAVSVNGHTGAFQTITAQDVGAYTSAQVDALLLQQSAAAYAASIIFSS